MGIGSAAKGPSMQQLLKQKNGTNSNSTPAPIAGGYKPKAIKKVSNTPSDAIAKKAKMKKASKGKRK